MIISRKKKGDKRTVGVSGNLTVANILKFKKTLLEDLNKGSCLELDIGEVKEMDLSFVQVLAAAVKSGENEGKEVTLRVPVPEAVVENLKLSGFLNHNNCARPGCIWCSILEQVQGA